jgi:hypothetical protein
MVDNLGNETEGFKAPPVKGYNDQKAAALNLVNTFKVDEERLLRAIEATGDDPEIVADGRWLAIARTHFQQGFMALNRAVFKPGRVNLPEDGE